MGSHNGDNVDMLEVEETKTSEPTVEIKIKTLDSQTYTLRVDKCVPVPTLKDQIATLTGILSDQQRLICRGRVLKDDQLLSAYHVEDGHTLHLVVREPIPLSQSMNDHAGPENQPSVTETHSASRGPRVIIGTFNISDETQGGVPADLSRILSDFMGSLGVPLPLNRNGSTIDSNWEPPTLVAHRTTSGGESDSVRMHPVSISGGSQHASQMRTSIAQYPPVISGALSTLSQYLNQVTAEFVIANGGEERSPFPGSPPFGDGFEAPEISQVASSRGMPSVEALAELLQSTQQLLINQTAESLSRLATQLHNQRNVTDATARMRIQSNSMRSGIIFRNLGALLLELGRTTMMLRMGETPADAVVNAGSAVFVNEHGPNPITVQPFPMGSELSGTGLGSSFFPNNTDIRIRTGEQTGQQQSPGPASQATSGISLTTLRRLAVHIIPIRVAFGAVLGRASQSTDPSRSLNEIIVPDMSRVQPTSAIATDISGSASDGHVGDGGQPGTGNEHATATQYFEDLDEYLENMINNVNEQLPFLPQIPATNSSDSSNPSAGASDSSPQTQTAPGDDGIFLSNGLHHIMPHITRNPALSSAAGPSSAEDDNGQGNIEQENENAIPSMRRQSDEHSSSEAKRQRRE